MNNYVSYQKFSVSAVINTSARPVAIWGIYVESGTNGAGVVSLYDGISTAGIKVGQFTGTTDDGNWPPQFQRGYVLPSGGFINMDTNTSYVIVWYETLS